MIRVDSQAPQENLNEYRSRLIRETEMFLNWYLQSDACSCAPEKGYCNGHEFIPQRLRKDSQPRKKAEAPVQRNSGDLGTLIEVHGDEVGNVDEEHIEDLILRLRNVTTRKRHGDVMLDLSAIRSVTTRFMRVFDTFRHELGEQQRHLFLNGIDHIRIHECD